MNGRISYFNTVRRFGFILCAGKQIFFHASNCNQEPVVGAQVTFDHAPAFRENMPQQAVNVTMVSVGAVVGGV